MRGFVDKVYTLAIKYWPLVLLLIVGLVLLMRLHWFVRVLAAAVFVFICFVALAAAAIALYDLLTDGVDEPRFLVRLRSRAARARERIKFLADQIEEIEGHIAQLRNIERQPNQEASGKQWDKSLALLKGYEEELALRRTKLAFYRRSLRSLGEIESKWVQERRLKELQRDLDQLRTPSKQEVEQMKLLREELAYEAKLLTTYQELSKRIDKVEKLAEAQAVRRELDRLLE